MRVIISGDRNWRCAALARRVVARMVERFGADLIVVSGTADGVDTAFAAECQARGVAYESHIARWDKYGKGAGPIRNQAMIEAGADFCIAVHRNLAWSRGTKDLVCKALAAGMPVYLIDSEEGEPRRVHESDLMRQGKSSMKVYLVILEDRHIDLQVEVYATAEAAMERARRIVERYDYTPEEPDEPIPGYLFYATLSCESDCVRVEEVEVR